MADETTTNQPPQDDPGAGAGDTSADAAASDAGGSVPIDPSELSALFEAATNPQAEDAPAAPNDSTDALGGVSDGEIEQAIGSLDSEAGESAADVEAKMQAMLDGAGDDAGGADDVEAQMQAMLDGADGDAEADGAAGDIESQMQSMLNDASADATQETAAALSAAAAPAMATAETTEPADPRVIGKRAPDVPAEPFAAPDFGDDELTDELSGINLLDDVELNVRIELGRTEMYIEDVLRLGGGSVVQLDKLAGDPVDVYVNERLVARGEVLVLNDNFCVRINDIISPVPELEG